MVTIEVEHWEMLEQRYREVRDAEIAGGRRAQFLLRGVGHFAWELT